MKLLNLHKKLKIKKAIDAMKNMAALHEPDMFAGGYFDCKPTCMGDASVNSSIGAQWKKIISDMDKYADDAIKAGTGNSKLNLKLDICPK
ncbi:polymorphic toxin type 15 domain-containing protein [Acinetobacter junii]|uniref:polymorphic toxin type 15 domain-containing protein n=1 Tax=Acinetobacter junii TaxID=40215 RepID=UPI002FDC2F54